MFTTCSSVTSPNTCITGAFSSDDLCSRQSEPSAYLRPMCLNAYMPARMHMRTCLLAGTVSA